MICNDVKLMICNDVKFVETLDIMIAHGVGIW